MKTDLRPACPEEAEACYAVLDGGRRFQREQGFEQWDDAYPTLALVKRDIEEGVGWVVTADGAIAVYLCIRFDGEPAYLDIEGEWATPERYAVVHRMAVGAAFRGKGLGGETFRLVGALAMSRGVNALRADTHFPNLRMQHVLEKAGFVRRGIITYPEGRRIAYDKTLTD